MLYGVLDIGSNTIRLVVYKVEDKKIIPIFNKKNLVGLANYIDQDNILSKEGQEVAVKALKEFEEMIDLIKIDEVFLFATAPLRNINNSNEALEYINSKVVFSVKVLTGNEEALFDYYGAIQSVDTTTGVMVDIGGGSTEILFYKDNEVVRSYSVPVGSLLLYSRYVDDLIPTVEELEKIQKIINGHLSNLKVPNNGEDLELLCGVGGSARAVMKFMQNKSSFDQEKETYPTKELDALLEIAKSDPKRFMKSIIKVCPDRIHTFTIGLTILNEIAKHYKSTDIITSGYGVREGYLYHILKERGEL